MRVSLAQRYTSKLIRNVFFIEWMKYSSVERFARLIRTRRIHNSNILENSIENNLLFSWLRWRTVSGAVVLIWILAARSSFSSPAGRLQIKRGSKFASFRKLTETDGEKSENRSQWKMPQSTASGSRVFNSLVSYLRLLSSCSRNSSLLFLPDWDAPSYLSPARYSLFERAYRCLCRKYSI